MYVVLMAPVRATASWGTFLTRGTKKPATSSGGSAAGQARVKGPGERGAQQVQGEEQRAQGVPSCDKQRSSTDTVL